ncbi:hypothetical protein D1012_12950 [Pseudotabrizicola alkalilacus]|uniref:Uncharacterized protein n=1 Tax=Pseudotabrizicola alkalilacus TaxID=2305252 RepID=A0A411Z0I1_9RHOB|nr:hypothetical protein D1012_12950 [Pseudotabrizicola alkalilacus]
MPRRASGIGSTGGAGGSVGGGVGAGGGTGGQGARGLLSHSGVLFRGFPPQLATARPAARAAITRQFMITCSVIVFFCG